MSNPYQPTGDNHNFTNPDPAWQHSPNYQQPQPQPNQYSWPASDQQFTQQDQFGDFPQNQRSTPPYAAGPQPGYPQHQPFPPSQPYAQPNQQLAPANPYHYVSQGSHMPVARKEPWISLLVSFFVPGVGSIINGDTSRGIGILVGYIVCFSLGFAFLLPWLAMFLIWIWGLVDAYQGAERFNRTHGLY